MQVVVDVFERRSGVPTALRGLGIEVVERPLPAGDYALSDHCVYKGALGAEGVRGLLLAVSDLGVTVIKSQDAADSAHWIRRILIRRTRLVLRDRPPYAQRAQRRILIPRAEVALAAAPGVSTDTSRRLLEHFGSLVDVLLASSDDLRLVRGVGEKRAQAIQNLARGR
jgi:ERCC4-type nuclease